MSDDNKKVYITLIAGIAGISLLVIGVLAVVLLHMSNNKKKEVESTTEVAATEEVVSEDASEEASGNGCWFADKTIYNPTMTPETISLPKADLSVFDNGAGDINSVDLSEGGSGGDPWAAVTLKLDSIPGSINKTSPSDDKSKTEQLTSTYMILVDLDNDTIVAERDCEKVIVPASMTKILSVITARDYIDPANLKEKQVITPENLSKVSAHGLSAVGFLPNSKVNVKDLLYGTIVCSGADAAWGLADYCSGSEEAFVEKMNENVDKMGLSETAHFTNPVGVHDKNNHCTMKDMAVIMGVAVQDELLLDVLSKRIYTTDKKYPKKDLPNGIEISNWFLRRIEDKEFNGNVIAAKTGFVNESMFCAASYYKSNSGKNYVCVTGNAFSSWRAIYDHASVYRSFTE